LSADQQLELQAHLRSCTSCTAIAETNLALHATRRLAPAAGFAERFGTRLIERRRTTRLRQIIGMAVFVLIGLGLLAWLAGPALERLIQSPGGWIAALVGSLISILTTARTATDASRVLLQVVSDFIPPAAWVVLLTVLIGLGFLWTTSIRRFSLPPQGVEI
jgi:hypothetical protein